MHTIDEQDAALYDRQIRLWGVSYQQRLRNASVLVLTVRGLAAEVCKNLVLAGIGRLTVVDEATISEADLGANYFLRASDIGLQRAPAVLHRLQALNPRVQISTIALNEALEQLSTFDLVCVTDASTSNMLEINSRCRRLGIKFYAAASLGLTGFVFADLIEHKFVVERIDRSQSSDGEHKLLLQRHQAFVPLGTALAHDFGVSKAPLRPKVLKRLVPLLEVLALLSPAAAEGNESMSISDRAMGLLRRQNLDQSVLDNGRLSFLGKTASSEFAPSCAVLGGVLAQDILNALGGREAPLVNFFIFDGETNTGDIHALGLQRG